MQSDSSKRWILFFFCCSSVLITFNTTALIAAIPEISRSLKMPVGDVANIVGYYMIPYGICALFYAPLATKFSIKHLMMASTMLYAVSNVMCVWSHELPIILISRIVAGFAAAAVTPLALMTLGKVFKKEVRGRVIGLFFSASFFGSMLGLIINSVLPWSWQFLIPAWMAFFLSIAYLFCPNKGMEANVGIKINYFDAFNMGGLRRLLFLIFFMSLLFYGVCKWYGVYLDKIYGFDQKTISLIFILTALGGSIGQNLGGIITDKYGRRISCYVGLIVLGLGIGMLYFHYSLFVLTGLLTLISLGWTIAHNGISTVLADFPVTYRLELASLNSSVRFFSGGIGFWVSGNFVQNNFGLTFLGIGALMLSQCIFINKIIPSKAGL